MELKHEAGTTRRVLERVPQEQLTWKPHEKSMTLGRLAYHIATTPGEIADWLAEDTVQLNMDYKPVEPATVADILQAHEASIAKASAYLESLTPEKFMAIWRLMAGPQELIAMPRAVCIRSIMLNHWIHHRGQLSVYLRLLNVAVPSIYGPSADDNPMAQKASQSA